MAKFESDYLEGVKKQFAYYRLLGERTFSQLNDEQLFYRTDPESNSIAIIVNHISGNMLSRWTDFLNSDGEKTWRQRDLEFEDLIKDRNGMIEKWNAGWKCLFTALDSVNEANFHETVYIRNQGHSIVEAVNRQLAHYAYHIGQVVFIGRMLKGEDWSSLSIPKGRSEDFNSEKFSQEKHRAHFTDEFLDSTDTK